jgi:hypothetical protein
MVSLIIFSRTLNVCTAPLLCFVFLSFLHAHIPSFDSASYFVPLMLAEEDSFSKVDHIGKQGGLACRVSCITKKHYASVGGF